VGDAVLAAQEDAERVHVLHALPGVDRSLDDRGVVGRVDSRVVEENVDAAELVAHPRVHRLDLALVGDVAGKPQLALGVVADVDSDDPGALGGEHPRGDRPDPTGGAGDHAHPSLEPPCHVIPPRSRRRRS
jgi:hypothetical protein